MGALGKVRVVVRQRPFVSGEESSSYELLDVKPNNNQVMYVPNFLSSA